MQCTHFLSPCPNLTLAKPSHLTEHIAGTTPALNCGGKALAQRKRCPSPKNTSLLAFVGKSRCTEKQQLKPPSLRILSLKASASQKLNKILQPKQEGQVLKTGLYSNLAHALHVSKISGRLTTFMLSNKDRAKANHL